MHSAPSWIRHGLLVALIVVVGTVVAQALRSGSHDGPLPSIGGDTWPPVPVKDVRPA
jgi:hypothetical protein